MQLRYWSSAKDCCRSRSNWDASPADPRPSNGLAASTQQRQVNAAPANGIRRCLLYIAIAEVCGGQDSLNQSKSMRKLLRGSAIRCSCKRFCTILLMASTVTGDSSMTRLKSARGMATTSTGAFPARTFAIDLPPREEVQLRQRIHQPLNAKG